MVACWCSLAGTAACQHCRNNPMATDVWSNETVTVDHIEAKPFGNGIDVCPVCGKPYTIGKPITNYDRIVSKSPEELAKFISDVQERATVRVMNIVSKLGVAIDIEPESVDANVRGWIVWMKQEAGK